MIGDQYCQYGSATFFKGLRITKHDNTKHKPLTKLNVNDVVGPEDETKHETERFVRMKTKITQATFCKFFVFCFVDSTVLTKAARRLSLQWEIAFPSDLGMILQ